MTTGRDTEQAALKLYQDVGYETYLPPKAKYREQDVFGLFDILAFGHGQLVCSQVKTNRARGVGDWFDQARRYEEHLTDVTVEFLVRYDDQGWKLYRTAQDGYQVAYDGREIEHTPGGELRSVLRP